MKHADEPAPDADTRLLEEGQSGVENSRHARGL